MHGLFVWSVRTDVYCKTEHIDNPKGYGAGEDPRKYHPKLRGPVEVCAGHCFTVGLLCWLQPIELEVDPRTGMKNYIANGRTRFNSPVILNHDFIQTPVIGIPRGL